MINSILGILNDKNITPTLLQGLQRLESEYGEYDWVGIATLGDGRIQHRQIQGNMQNLQRHLQQQPMAGNFGIAYLYNTASDEPDIPPARLYATEDVAVVYSGIVKNAEEMRDGLLDLGYEFHGKTNGEVIWRSINRYLDIGLSPEEATLVTTARLKGECSTIVLFAQPENKLIAAHRGSPLAIGVSENIFYVSSELKTLSVLSHQAMQLGEGYPVVLRSVNTALE